MALEGNMLILKENDYLDVKLNSLVADYDREVLANLYQPIIGYTALAVYFTLLSEADNQKINAIISHETLFRRMMINAKEFVDARHVLEATGLLKTYLNDMKGSKLYEYVIYAPKTPKLFFDNTLLYGMLLKNMGESETNKLKAIYQVDVQPVGKDITSSFMEVYSPDFDDPIFKKAMEASNLNVMNRQSAKMYSGFQYEKFFEALTKSSQIKSEAISKTDMKEIERLALLYGISEESAAGGVIVLYDQYAKKDERIDFDALAKRFIEETNYNYLAKGGRRRINGRISGESDLAHKINLMERLSPKEYLSLLQNGTIPAEADLKIINSISLKFRLPNSVINAIIDYVLTTNDNILSRSLAEKIAGSLARENIQTTIDAMNYLKKTTSKGRKKKEDKREEFVEKEKEKPAEQLDEKLDWDTLIKEIEGGSDQNGEN